MTESISVPSQSLAGQRATTLTHLVMLRLITGYTLFTVSLQQNTPYGIPSSITFVTRGNWTMHIVVSGSAGQGQADIPITAIAPPAMPTWLAWNIGLLPLYGILIFWGTQVVRKRNMHATTVEYGV